MFQLAAGALRAASSRSTRYSHRSLSLRSASRGFSAPSVRVPITVATGDGIGPEITHAVMNIVQSAGARLEPEYVEVGEKLFLAGQKSGIGPETWESIHRTRVMLKGPITTPSGSGYKSLNVTMRKTLGLYANVRSCVSYHPFIKTKHPIMDLVIVRENEEDLYAGIEHWQTDQVVQCLKLISRPGCEKICNYAFEYARRNKRKKVSCFVKDNIMKMTDGLFYKVFEEVAQRYPEIQRDKWIIDIGAARVADTPELFDVIVLPNLYGDVLSDIAAQITGSVGLGGSVNIGDSAAIFEAIHGSAPPIAGKNIANPSGLMLSACLMLAHIGQSEVATAVHNAWLYTIEHGVHTDDIFKAGVSSKKVGTREFADEVISNLGKAPITLKPADYGKSDESMASWRPPLTDPPMKKKEMVGVDVFLHWNPKFGNAEQLAAAVRKCEGDGMELVLITNRGVKVWPGGFPETFCTDHWRLRFKLRTPHSNSLRHNQIISLLMRMSNAGFDFIKMENLYTLDGTPGYSLGQGE